MISVIIPTYQERDNIEPLLRRLAAVRPSLGEPLEVLIVDSNSDDGTADYGRQLFGELIPGRVIALDTQQGLAAAVLEGVRQATGDVIGVMDADLSHPPEVLPLLVRAVRAGNQVAVASRYVRGGRIVNWRWSRRMLSRIGNLMARPLVPVADATSGYFVAETDLLKAIPRSPRGFKILLELLVRGCVHRVDEIPYVFVNRVRGASKLGIRILWLYLMQLGSLYVHRVIHPCPHQRGAPGLTSSAQGGCGDPLEPVQPPQTTSHAHG